MNNGWPSKSLGEVCENLDSKRVPITKSKRTVGKYPYYGASGVVDHVADYLFDEQLLLVSEDGANLLARTYPIAFSVSGKIWINNHAHVLRFADTTAQRFIEFYLNSIPLEPFVSGMAQPKLNQKSLNSIPVPTPPLPEQRRIVGILDEAFAGIATAKANAEKSLQNARALFESHLNAVFTQRGDGWVEHGLAEVVDADCTLSYGIVQPGNDQPNGLPIVRPTDLSRRIITLDGLKRIDHKRADSYQRTKLQGGELLLCVRGSTGVVALASPELAGANVTRGLVPIRFHTKTVNQRFGYFALSAPPVQSQIRERTYGAALMQINIRDVRKIAVRFPALSEQDAIATKLDAIEGETQRLESIYQRKLDALDELKKSLLHQAFSGQL